MSSPATVAAHLRQILDMAGRLQEQAIEEGRHVGSDGDRGLVGGEALVNLASVASKVEWLRRVDEREDAGAYDTADYEDPDELWPAEQILTWWSEDYRCRLGHMHDQWRPTLVSEAKFLLNRDVADWVWANEPRWDDYAADVERAKTKLENILREGERVAFKGVECMYDDCQGARLIRKTEPTRGSRGEKAWRLSDWFCPKCKRTWDEDEYTRRIYANIESTHWASLDDEMWCTTDRAARSVGRPEGTVRSWMSRGQVGVMCLLNDKLGNPTMVSLEDVRDRDRLAKERRARWLAPRVRAS